MFGSQGDDLTSPPVNACRRLPLKARCPGAVLQDYSPFYFTFSLSLSLPLHSPFFFFFLPYFLTFLYLCSIKESGIQTPIRWLFWVISLPSFLSTGFPKEVSFLPQHLVSDLFAFRSLEQSELGVCNKSNTFRAAKLLCHYRSLNTVSEDTT